ncbi:hypothetical protein E2C01_054999 [Portunus trituberculatus]|uniref:Uncharacterized protein n=1 Tax=Portunus trituberculatus TaxID=210409 RepID=A0A5B7GVF6_PORTR|nr:hypothetical protein [Portunus trituberculatus]
MAAAAVVVVVVVVVEAATPYTSRDMRFPFKPRVTYPSHDPPPPCITTQGPVF